MRKCLSNLLFYAACLYGINAAANDNNINHYKSIQLAEAWHKHKSECAEDCYNGDDSPRSVSHEKKEKSANIGKKKRDILLDYWW
jgi:hypothetical protein